MPLRDEVDKDSRLIILLLYYFIKYIFMYINCLHGLSCFLVDPFWGVLFQFCGSDLCLRMFITFVTVSFIGQYICYDILCNGALSVDMIHRV